jgi:hypothetical protein
MTFTEKQKIDESLRVLVEDLCDIIRPSKDN